MSETKLSKGQIAKFKKAEIRAYCTNKCRLLADSVAKAGDKDWALKIYKKAEKLAEDPSDYCELAVSVAREYNLGDKDWARKLFEKVEEQVETSGTYGLLVSYVADTFGFCNKDWARKLFEKAEELTEDSDDYILLARFVAEERYLGDKDWSRKLYEKAEEVAESSDDDRNLAIFTTNGEIFNEKIMSDKFNNVPLDDETKILSEGIVELGDCEALFQVWSWDGIVAQSIIFTETDAEKLSDDVIKKLIRTLKFIDKEIELEINRSVKGYTFVNFNLNFIDDDEI